MDTELWYCILQRFERVPHHGAIDEFLRAAQPWFGMDRHPSLVRSPSALAPHNEINNIVPCRRVPVFERNTHARKAPVRHTTTCLSGCDSASQHSGEKVRAQTMARGSSKTLRDEKNAEWEQHVVKMGRENCGGRQGWHPPVRALRRLRAVLDEIPRHGTPQYRADLRSDGRNTSD